MKTGTVLLLGATGALIVGGIAYKRGIDKLRFDLDGFQFAPGGSGLLIRLRVTNPNRFWGYPVPRMKVNAYDSAGNFIGTIINNQLQYIPANAHSYIYGIVSPDFASLIGVIYAAITSGTLPSGLSFQGVIQIGSINIPINTGFGIGGVRTLLNVATAAFALTDAFIPEKKK